MNTIWRQFFLLVVLSFVPVLSQAQICTTAEGITQNGTVTKRWLMPWTRNKPPMPAALSTWNWNVRWRVGLKKPQKPANRKSKWRNSWNYCAWKTCWCWHWHWSARQFLHVLSSFNHPNLSSPNREAPLLRPTPWRVTWAISLALHNVLSLMFRQLIYRW